MAISFVSIPQISEVYLKYPHKYPTGSLPKISHLSDLRPHLHQVCSQLQTDAQTTTITPGGREVRKCFGKKQPNFLVVPNTAIERKLFAKKKVLRHEGIYLPMDWSVKAFGMIT